MTKEELIQEAFKGKANSYSTYSKFPVGAAVGLKNGKVVYGTNVENASYPCGCCAERVALFSAYALGYRQDDIEALAIVTDADTVSTPCGVCRQVLNELLHKKTPIYLSNGTETIETDIDTLLPMSFGPEDLL